MAFIFGTSGWTMANNDFPEDKQRLLSTIQECPPSTSDSWDDEDDEISFHTLQSRRSQLYTTLVLRILLPLLLVFCICLAFVVSRHINTVKTDKMQLAQWFGYFEPVEESLQPVSPATYSP